MIYLVEDDKSIRELLVYTLNNSGLPANGFEKPSEFYRELRADDADLIILDIMLPECDGLTMIWLPLQTRSRLPMEHYI